jgi:outer membrane immunogenic protein
MKTSLLSAIAAAVIAASPALAADMPLKAPTAATAVYHWSGVYIGGEGGGTWRGHYDWAPQFPTIRSDLDGGFAGGTIGWNWRPAKWTVIGIEGDWSWADIKGDFPGGVLQCSAGFSCSAKIKSFGTARARFGVLAWDSNLLFYVTGGWAWAEVTRAQFTFPAAFRTPDVTRTADGVTFGGGVEWMILRNVSIKGEVLHLDLSREAYPSQNTLNPSSMKTSIDIVRGGLNWHFWSP